MDSQNQTDTELFAEFKRLSAIITKRRRNAKTKEPNDKIESVEPSEVKKGRPIVAAWRHREDGTYNKQAIDTEYAIKYWRDNFRKPFFCSICERTLQTGGSNVMKHQRTLHCQLAKFKKEQETN